MKVITYNVNGIRSAISKDLLGWLKNESPDVVCLQEIKASPDQISELAEFEKLGYHTYWFPAQKKGYSGVAILSKEIPKHIEYGSGIAHHDFEGRMIRADFADFSIMSLYLPSGSSGDERQVFKYKFLDEFFDYITEIKKVHPNLIISGDYNICHQAIDIHNPKSNANSSGFLPEERAWLDKFMQTGFIDTFRHFNTEADQYSWWTFRAGARGKNLGWRIDYHLATESLRNHLKSSRILADIVHSDHCPVVLELDFDSLKK